MATKSAFSCLISQYDEDMTQFFPTGLQTNFKDSMRVRGGTVPDISKQLPAVGATVQTCICNLETLRSVNRARNAKCVTQISISFQGELEIPQNVPLNEDLEVMNKVRKRTTLSSNQDLFVSDKAGNYTL